MMPGKHERLRLADRRADGGRIREHFQREHPAFAVRARDELLADDAAQTLADHDTNLLALIHREDIENAIKRAGGAARVQSAEHEMTRFRRADGERDRLQIAHFTDHDHVRVFAQRASQRRRE